MFWTFSAGALLFAALITFRPLLRGKTLWQPAGLALVFLLPAAALWMYTKVGTPAALELEPPRQAASAPSEHSPESQEMDAMIDSLRSKLTENPEDLDGWMLLARTLKTTQRFPEALAALETAHQIAPENPRVMVELAEAQIFVSPNGDISEDISALLQRALELDPSQQKALWLLGIAASQAGDYAFAISYWESLLEQVEPGSAIAQSVQSQINQAKTELGMEVEEVPVVAETEGAWQGIRLTVSADTGAAGMIPTGGVLYVMIRTAGMAMGPPIGVRRIIDPLLPLDITISDADSMLKERQISAETEIQLQARISLTGSPSAKPGDWQSTPMVIAIDSNSPVELVIDQQVE